MKFPTSLRLAFVLVATLCLGVAVTALARDDKDEAKKDDAATAADKAKGSEAKGSAAKASDRAAEMEAWLKLAQPGEQHQRLQRMAGTYDTDAEMVMAPGAPAQKSKGKQKYEVLLGGRYLHGEYSGDMMGMPFKGMSLMGYDNQKKKYFTAWIDSMSTGLMVSEGTADSSGKVLTFTGSYDDPMSGKTKKYRQVTTVVSPDKHTFEWFENGDDGKEYRMMMITYTRTK
jgi:Protein of unknown function (DUF1579)